MRCARLICAQSLTVLSLKIDAGHVAQFLTNVEKSKRFDTYVVIPSDGLPTLDVHGCLGPKDYG